MRSALARWCVAASVCLLAVASGMAFAQQQTTSTEKRAFEIIAVDGNTVVARGEQGTKEYQVPEDFRFTVDGRQVSVHELKPGMKGTAIITTTTTVTPVYVTEVRNGTVVQASGNTVVVRGPKGLRMFSEADVAEHGIKIFKHGEPARIDDLHVGDMLSATIVTKHPPEVVTERQVQAIVKGMPPASRAPAQAPAAPSASASQTGATAAPATGATPARRLPKTASDLPLVGLIGAFLVAVGVVLTVRRRILQQG